VREEKIKKRPSQERENQKRGGKSITAPGEKRRTGRHGRGGAKVFANQGTKTAHRETERGCDGGNATDARGGRCPPRGKGKETRVLGCGT